ncbi:hypothetical protein MITS9509_03199 [Synechococcus sp. MIT S9509]|uniref:hypothetical protein n=1 Tax=unclassified Synechococcus TaxID=2626047 RepID=UPI0007BB7F3C|nr:MULTISPECIES: hypothetical protein [unclassified Synechococcus]KZR84128.1 hypothetical protein MITS9504_03105 [Synechococcus sp. MIT S9504]KZR88873.1 hypothetical protein MITS9509_03199 [Synechococcus sp. MIT S9509]
MTPGELQRYGVRNGVLLSREVRRNIADFRDELGQTVQLDGLIEAISGTHARVCVLLHVGNKGIGSRGGPMLGTITWVNESDLEPYEGINVWAQSLVRKILRKRAGKDVSQPRESPFWAEL